MGRRRTNRNNVTRPKEVLDLNFGIEGVCVPYSKKVQDALDFIEYETQIEEYRQRGITFRDRQTERQNKRRSSKQIRERTYRADEWPSW